MKKKRIWWCFFPIIIGISGIIALFFWAFGNQDYQSPTVQKKVDNVYSMFQEIKAQNDFCLDCPTFVSYSDKLLTDTEMTKFVKKTFTGFYRIRNIECVFATEDYFYCGISILHKGSNNFYVYKQDWDLKYDAEEIIKYNFPQKSCTAYFYNAKPEGFEFMFLNAKTNAMDLIYCNVLAKETYYSGNITDSLIPSYQSFIRERKIESFDEIGVSKGLDKHKTSFSSSCYKAFETMKSEGFKPHSQCEIGNYSLCLYKKSFGSLFKKTVFAIFSYNWMSEEECFQGLLTTDDNSDYHIMKIYKE